jgi:TolA-binding protein
MERKNIEDDGLDPLAKGVVALIGEYTDIATKAIVARPPAFAPLAARLMRSGQHVRLKRGVLAFASCALVAGAVAGLWVRRPSGGSQRAALTYTINGQPSRPGAIGPASTAKPVLSFSDGTQVELGVRARGRVLELGQRGARVALDEGHAHVDVAHRAGAQWFFEAGPFLITVHGTAFSFAWDTRQSRLDVRMERGIVSVTGPLSGGEIYLRAGQTLSVSLNDLGTPKLDTTAQETSSPSNPPPGDSAAALAPAGSGSLEPPRPASRAGAAGSWVAKLADGGAAAVVADAERRGLVQVLKSSSSEDLAALADASRYERNDGLARRALLAQRRRFPRSERASEASFLLGRLDDASDEGAERALRWYDQYLREAPKGAYVSEALGREMMVLERAHRESEATAIATDYLRRFPTGTYAHAAQALVRAP